MPNRYYLLDLSVQGNTRLQNARSRLAFLAGVRTLPHQIGHHRLSLAGTLGIIQGEATEADHTWFVGQAWATHLGDYVDGQPTAAVRDYLTTNRLLWEPVL